MYTPASVTGILFGAGQAAPQQLAPDSLCTLAEAQFINEIFGGILINAAGDPAIGTFVNLDPASKYQPWILVGPNNAWDGTFIGPRVAQMGGIDVKGTWSGIGTGNPTFTPTPPPPPAPAPIVDDSGDAATMLNILTGGKSSAPATSGGTGDSSDASDLAIIKADLAKIIAWFHIQ